MSDEHRSPDEMTLDGDAPMRANNNDSFSADDSGVNCAENNHARGDSMAFCPSLAVVSVGNGTGETSPAPDTSSSSPPVLSFTTETYMEVVRRGMEDLAVDSNILTSISRSRNEMVVRKDGVIVFDIPWFAAMHDSLVNIMSNAKTQLRPSVTDNSSSPEVGVELNCDVSRGLFMQNLRQMSDTMARRYFTIVRSMPWGRFQRDIAPLLDIYTQRLLSMVLKTPNVFTPNDTCATVEDVIAVLIHYFNAWIAYFCPYLKYAISSGRPMHLIWNDNLPDKSEVAFQVYSTTARINLRNKDKQVIRGVLFPVKWMHKLLNWLCSTDDVNPKPPGPFDTFQLIKLSSDDAAKHIIECVKDKEPDIITEELFDLLWSLFGGGPKYIVEGVFSMKNQIEERLRPERTSVTVVFDSNNGDVHTVSLKGILNRAKLSESMRMAFHELHTQQQQQKRKEEEKEEVHGKEFNARLWRAALCYENAVDAYVTHVKGVQLGGERLVREVSRYTLGEVIHEAELEVETGTNPEAPDVQLRLYLRERENTFNLHTCGVCGILNIGNTCYMNSALQCLSNIEAMRDTLFAFPYSEYMNPIVTRAMGDLLLKLWSGREQKVDPHSLKRAIGCVSNRFDSYEQQDSMELIETLLDSMHEEINRVTGKCYREVLDTDESLPIVERSKIFWDDFLRNNNTFIPPLFFFQTIRRLECLTCKRSSIMFENNLSISANIVTPVRKRILEGIVVMPAGQRVRLGIEVTCNENGCIYAEDISREIIEKLHSKDVNIPSSSSSSSSSSLLSSTDIPDLLSSPPANNVVDTNESIDTTTTTTNNNNNNNDNRINRNEKGIDVRCLLLNGYKTVVYGDANKPYPENDVSFCAAIVPVLTEGDHVCGNIPRKETLEGEGKYSNNNNEKGEEEKKNNNNHNEDEKEKKEEKQYEEEKKKKNVYVWYFLKKKSAYYSPQDGLCYVEELSTKEISHSSTFESHIYKHCKDLEMRFLKRKFPRGSEGPISIHDFLTGESVGDNNKELIHISCHPDIHRMKYTTCSEEGKWDFTRVNDAVDLSCGVHVLLEYDDYVLTTNENFDTVFDSPVSRPNDYYLHRGRVKSNYTESPVTLQECLESTYQPDILTGDNAPECSRCRSRSDGKIERRLFLLPPTLIISLKRFKVHMEEASKNNTHVTVPMVLDMAPYLDPESQVIHKKYRLRGIVSHSGSINFGHYTATALNDSSGKWILYNDWQTSELPSGPCTKDAFILFYEVDKVEIDKTKNPGGERSSRL